MILTRREGKKMNFSNLCLYYLSYGLFFFCRCWETLKNTHEKENYWRKIGDWKSVLEKRKVTNLRCPIIEWSLSVELGDTSSQVLRCQLLWINKHHMYILPLRIWSQISDLYSNVYRLPAISWQAGQNLLSETECITFPNFLLLHLISVALYSPRMLG